MTRETREYTVATYDSLTLEQQKKALDKYRYINVEHDWWEATYEDATNVGLEIEAFDLDRRTIRGSFISNSEDTTKAILESHGSTCTTYGLAKEFLEDKAIDAETFLKKLLKSYLVLLQEEYNYRISDEAIAETLLADEYMFDLRTLKID